MTAPKISLVRLRQLIKEELEDSREQDPDYKAYADWVRQHGHITTHASSVLSAYVEEKGLDAAHYNKIAKMMGFKEMRGPRNANGEHTRMGESVDHKSISDVVNVASKLLAAVEGFKEKAPPAAINAVTPHLGELEKVLENMVGSPGSYVPTPKKEPKKVSLKAVKAA
jgi:hypothetical protein